MESIRQVETKLREQVSLKSSTRPIEIQSLPLLLGMSKIKSNKTHSGLLFPNGAQHNLTVMAV